MKFDAVYCIRWIIYSSWIVLRFISDIWTLRHSKSVFKEQDGQKSRADFEKPTSWRLQKQKWPLYSGTDTGPNKEMTSFFSLLA